MDSNTELNSEPRVLNSFEKLDETLERLNAILRLSLSEEPPASEEKVEESQVLKITQIVNFSSPLCMAFKITLPTASVVAQRVSRTAVPP